MWPRVKRSKSELAKVAGEKRQKSKLRSRTSSGGDEGGEAEDYIGKPVYSTEFPDVSVKNSMTMTKRKRVDDHHRTTQGDQQPLWSYV